MWNRLSGVASNVAGFVGQVNDEQLQNELNSTRDVLSTTQDELKTALRIIEERDQEILNLSKTNVSTSENRTAEDLEKIRHKLARISLDDPELVEDVISEISFSLSEKSTTISQLQTVIDEMRERENDQGMPPNSPTCDDFYESQISRLTELCTSLRHKEKGFVSELEELRCALTDARAEIHHLKSEKGSESEAGLDTESQELVSRLEEENRLLLSKVASEAAHKDILRDQLDALRENDQDKFHLLDNIKELQDALQNKTSALSTEKTKLSDLTKECDNLQSQLAEFLGEKQRKLEGNLFEVKEAETEDEEIERIKVENGMLINKISDLITVRDKAREEIDMLTERMTTSKDSLVLELREKEHELEDAMMIVSLLQEQIKNKDGQDTDKITGLLEEIRDKNSLLPKLSFLQNELAEARRQVEELQESSQTSKDKNQCSNSDDEMLTTSFSACALGTEDVVELQKKLQIAHHTLAEWQNICTETVAVWRHLIAQDGLNRLPSVTEEDESHSAGEHSELRDLITTAELLQDQYRAQCSTPQDNTEIEHLQSEVERLKDCIRAREELISGLREDINMRQEKESSYREKVAELYSEIEKSQVGQGVKDVIDFSDSFVSGLEEQLSVAQRILKIKEEEITGLNKKVNELTTRPLTPTSPAPKYDSFVESNVKELKQKLTDVNKQLVEERDQTINLQMTIDDLNCQITALQKDVAQKNEDINRVEKEYEAEMLSMSANYKDQKAMNCEELGQLTVNVEDLRSEIKDLERDNMYLSEKYERVNQEHVALIAQLETSADGEGVEVQAIQAKCNLKEQQLNNALSEIDVLRDTLQAKSDAFNDLENSLTEQREVNVDLQNLINELKDRCDVLSDKEGQYQREISGLYETIKGYEANNEELRTSLTSATEKQTMHETHIQHSIRDLSSALQELKLSKENLKVDVQSDLNNIASQWSECVEEIRRQALQMSSVADDGSEVNSKVSLIVSSIKKLQQNYLSIKAEVEKLLHCDVNTMFPELKVELDKIVELTLQKDERIKTLEQEVQKFKTAGKKIIDKLKKQVKDKDMMIKKMASETKDNAVIALQEANTALTKQLNSLERDNEKLTNDFSDLKEQSLVLETSMNDSSVTYDKLSTISSEVEIFIRQYQSVYHCQLIDNDFDIGVFSSVSPRMINLAQENVDKLQDIKCQDEKNVGIIEELSMEIQDLKRAKDSLTVENKDIKEGTEALQGDFDKMSDMLVSKTCMVEDLTVEVSSLLDLKSVLQSRDEEITKLQDTLSSLRVELDSAQQSINNTASQDSDKISTLQTEIEEYMDKNKDLQWKVSNLTESLDCKQLEMKKLADKLEMLISDCEDKDSGISELTAKCEELEQTVDTLSSQVSYLAEEKDCLEKSLLEKENEMENSVNVSTTAGDSSKLEEALVAKTNECKKAMGIIKKFKMVKEDSEKKCKSLEAQVVELQKQLSNAQEKISRLQQISDKSSTPLECIEMSVEDVPEISATVQSAVHAEVECVNSLAINITNSASVHTPSDHVVESRDSGSQSEQVIAEQQHKIESLQAEVVHLYNELRLFEDSLVSKDDSILSLSEQLALSKQLLADTKQDCESKLVELQREHQEYDALLKRMQKDKEEWSEKEKQLRAQASLTEAETVRLMSNKPPVHEQDTVSEVSHTSIMSHDTSFMSVSSLHRDMPCDVESLQAELMKKNKLAFLIKTKAKKLESRVKDAKREADKSKAHDRVKEKIAAVETELSKITAELRNLSTGKKIESQTVKIDPKYVEEIEVRLKQSSEKYEQIMIEYQNQLRLKDDAVAELDHMNHAIHDLEDQMEVLQEDLRNKDALLCEHINAAADDEARNEAIRQKFAQQNDELDHLRDLNKKMKEALIEMTDESARIEQTYKSTMHELEDDADRLKCDNATLSNELTNCWAKIEDLEEQNQNYMQLLESAHHQLREQSTAAPALEAFKHQTETLTEQLNQYAHTNQELSEKLSVSEREKSEVMKQLVELKQMYDEGLESKSIISSEKDKLLSLIQDLETKVKESQETLKQEQETSSRTQSELDAYKSELDALKETNAELQAQLETSGSSVESIKSTMSSKLKHLQEERSLLQNQFEESQFLADSLQEQLNIATEEKTKTSVQLEKVYNQLNDTLSDKDGCTSTIASLENRCSSLEKELMSNAELIESLKEEQNVIMESNMEVVNEKDLEIERLNQICQESAVIEESLTSVNVELQSLKSEKATLELEISDKCQIESNLKAELLTLEETISNLKLEQNDSAAALSTMKIELSEKNDTIQSLSVSLDEAKSSYDEQLDAKLTELEQCESKRLELESELSSSQQFNTELQKQVESLQSESSEASADLATKHKELEQELDSVHKSKEELEKQVEELSAANSLTATQLQEASYNLEQWGYYNEGQQQIIADLQTQVTTITEEASCKSSELQEEISKLNGDVERLTTDKSKLEEDISALKDQDSDTQSKLKSLTSEIENLVSEKEETSQRLEKFTEEEIKLKKEVEDANFSAKSSSEAQLELENQISDLRSELASVIESKEQLESDNAELKVKVEKLDGLSSDEATQLKVDLEAKEKCLEEKIHLLAEIRASLDEKDQQCSDLKEQLTEMDALKNSLSEKKQSISSLEQQLDDAYAGNEEALGVLNGEIEKLKGEITKFERENERLSSSKDVLEDGLAKLQDSLEESKNTVVRYEQMLADWTNYGEQREAYVTSLNEQLVENQRFKEELQSEVDKFNQSSAEMSQKCESLEKNLEEAQNNLTKATGEKEAIAKKTKGIMKAYKDTKIQIEKLKKEAQDKGNELSEQLQAQINDLTIAQATLTEQNTRLSNEKNELMSEVENFEMEREFMTTLKDENTALKQSFLEQSQRMEQMQSVLDNTASVEADLVSFREAKESADSKLAELSEKISTLEKTCTEKEAVIADLITQNERISSLEDDCNGKAALITDLTSKNNNLVSDLNLSNSKLDSLQTQIGSFIQSMSERDLVQFNAAQSEVPHQFSAIIERLVELSKSLHLTESELESLKNQTVELKEEANLLKSAKESLDSTDRTNEELRRKIEFLERDHSEHEHTVELLHQKFDENYEELAAAKTTLASKETELSDVTNQLQTTISNLVAKEGKIKELESTISEKDSEMMRVQQNFDSQIKHFHKSAADQQNEMLNHQRELESLRADKLALEEDTTSKSNKISTLLEEMDGYRSQVSSLSNDVSSLQQEYDSLKSKLSLTETEFESVSEQLSNKDSTIRHLEDEINSLRRRLDAANSPDKDEELLNAIRQKDDVIEELRGELDTLQRDLQLSVSNKEQQSIQFDSEKSALVNEIKTLQNDLESVRAELLSKEQNAGILYGQINDINEHLLQTTETNATLKAEVEEASQKLSETTERLEAVTVHKEKVEEKMGDLLQEKQDLQTLCDSLTNDVRQLESKNQELGAELSKSNLDRNVLQKSVSEQNKLDSDVLLTKLSSLEELNKTLEQSLLNSEENIGEITANYEQKCMEMTAVERDLSTKKEQIHSLKEKLGESEGRLSEKVKVITQLETDFNNLVTNNAGLEKKLNDLLSEDTKSTDSRISLLKVDLEQALVDNQMLRDNNTMLVTNNTQLTENYKQLHDSVAVFQQRDTVLNEMCQKLQAHTTSLEAHIKTTTEEFNKKAADSEKENSALKSQLASLKSGSASTPQLTDLKDELLYTKNSKEKLASEVETYQTRLQVATSRADTLEKSLQDITSRYNAQCATVEKKTADLTKLMKQYKHIKQKLVNELNTRKSLVQETINGKDKVAIQFGEKSKRLKELQSQLFSCQKDRETLTAAVEGILDSITPLRGGFKAETEQDEPVIDNMTAVIDNLEHKTKDILTFLSRPLPQPSLSRVDLSAYRDSDLWSDYSRGADSLALSDSVSDFGENRSLRSDLSLFSGITNTSIQTSNTNNQTLPIIRDRKGSGTSSSSDRQRANSTNTEISRTSTGVINRLAYNLMGDTRGRTPSGNT